MSSALALQDFGFDDFEQSVPVARSGAQTLLLPQRPKTSYVVQGAAVALYALALTGLTLYSARPAPPAEEEAIELVMLPPAVQEEQPAPEPPPPVAQEIPQPPEPEMAPPPPVAEEPAVAPVPVEPPKPKPIPQPKPKVVEHKPAPVQHAAPTAAHGPAVVPPGAIASGYANQVHSRIAAAAASLVTRPGHPTGRVGYRIVISPSGSVVSQTITSSSGNPALDAAAAQVLARTSFPASGMPTNVAESGAIVVR
jgi:protein TonB